MALSADQRAVILAGRHPSDAGGSTEEEFAVNFYHVAHAAGVRPGSFREMIFGLRMLGLNRKGLIRQYPNGWYVLTDTGRRERDLMRAFIQAHQEAAAESDP